MLEMTNLYIAQLKTLMCHRVNTPVRQRFLVVQIRGFQPGVQFKYLGGTLQVISQTKFRPRTSAADSQAISY